MLLQQAAQGASVSKSTAERALEDMLPDDSQPGEVEVSGKGVKGNPFKYRLRIRAVA